MPRKPNYKFERLERQKAKAAKKAARLEAKMEKSEKRKAEEDGLMPVDGDAAASSEVAPGEPAENGDPEQ